MPTIVIIIIIGIIIIGIAISCIPNVISCDTCKHKTNPKTVYAKACYDCNDFCNYESGITS